MGRGRLALAFLWTVACFAVTQATAAQSGGDDADGTPGTRVDDGAAAAGETAAADLPLEAVDALRAKLAADGYTDEDIEKSVMPALMRGVAFREGHRYEDFIAGEDHVAEYGLAALVAGGVAAKSGLFKALLVALKGGWKIALLGLLAVGGFARRLFGGKTANDDATPPA